MTCEFVTSESEATLLELLDKLSVIVGLGLNVVSGRLAGSDARVGTNAVADVIASGANVETDISTPPVISDVTCVAG